MPSYSTYSPLGGTIESTELNTSIRYGFAPIGTILPWAKTLTGTPALPTGWAECDGSTISDADSPYNGVAVPNLLSANRFLRGNTTSGGTGGSATQTLITANLPSHTHPIPTRTSSGFTGGTGVLQNGSNSQNSSATTTEGTGSGTAFSIEPQYYDVVYIIRIK